MKDIAGYEGLYAVTSCGKVWSYKSKKFLTPGNNHKGYLQVGLRKNGERKWYLVHRLVADAYIPNSDNLPMINHKDENKANNCLQNLEWCDAKYNNTYGSRIDRVASRNKKPILQYTLDGEFVREWPSASDVGKDVNANITHCLRGDQKTAYNYIWKYKE